MSNQTTSASDQAVTYKQGRVFKVIVIGDSNVGKTTLTYRFCEGKFLESAEATIGVDFRSRTLNIDGDNITLWDTAGQERYRNSMIQYYYRNTHAVIFVYDVTNVASFESLKKWIIESSNHCLQDVPRILVGNKCDGALAVSTNVAQQFADLQNMLLFETSAKLDSQCDNVEAIFLTLAHKLKHQKTFLPSPSTIKANEVNEKPKESSSCC